MKSFVRSLCCVSVVLLVSVLMADQVKAQGYVVYSPPVFAPVAQTPVMTVPVVQPSFAPASGFVAARPVLPPTNPWAPAPVMVARPVLAPAVPAPVFGTVVPVAAPPVVLSPKVYVPGRPVRNFFEAIRPY